MESIYQQIYQSNISRLSKGAINVDRHLLEPKKLDTRRGITLLIRLDHDIYELLRPCRFHLKATYFRPSTQKEF